MVLSSSFAFYENTLQQLSCYGIMIYVGTYKVQAFGEAYRSRPRLPRAKHLRDVHVMTHVRFMLPKPLALLSLLSCGRGFLPPPTPRITRALVSGAFDAPAAEGSGCLGRVFSWRQLKPSSLLNQCDELANRVTETNGCDRGTTTRLHWKYAVQRCTFSLSASAQPSLAPTEAAEIPSRQELTAVDEVSEKLFVIADSASPTPRVFWASFHEIRYLVELQSQRRATPKVNILVEQQVPLAESHILF